MISESPSTQLMCLLKEVLNYILINDKKKSEKDESELISNDRTEVQGERSKAIAQTEYLNSKDFVLVQENNDDENEFKLKEKENQSTAETSNEVTLNLDIDIYSPGLLRDEEAEHILKDKI